MLRKSKTRLALAVALGSLILSPALAQDSRSQTSRPTMPDPGVAAADQFIQDDPRALDTLTQIQQLIDSIQARHAAAGQATPPAPQQ